MRTTPGKDMGSDPWQERKGSCHKPQQGEDMR